MKKIILHFLLWTAFFPYSYAETTNITVWADTLNAPGITKMLLERALQITQPEYGDYYLIISNAMEQERALRELANNRLDIAHFVSTADRERQVSPIRIPIMQGLLGYRLCLIKKGNQEKFTGITNKQQWVANNITIGQHSNWPDTKILRSNGFTVQTTYKHELLFQQLAKNRFDCFARGVSEIGYEQISHRALDLAIEKNIVIHYPLPQFYFVNPAKPVLAERLQVGLAKLQKNGEATRMFDFYFKDLLTALALKNRTFIELQNLTQSPETIDAMQAPIAYFEKKYLQKSN
jgi:hypothetical protein